ncbi:23091_t:CDS:2 [Cetraspora pellucida]|uniref:23091_t:CDS:1 n=1 Tax=Cetraspora pellucida TaxID=1433469 RepID=A0A9N9BHE0_9GLOM|nr:23091_t:CDS:2 [Cetraspora pellucida]
MHKHSSCSSKFKQVIENYVNMIEFDDVFNYIEDKTLNNNYIFDTEDLDNLLQFDSENLDIKEMLDFKAFLNKKTE